MRSTSTSSPPRFSRSSSAARQASRTAPAAIHVIRDAEAEPAEPTDAVECGASATSSVPSSVRATWSMTPTTPWPTSAAAEWTTALPSARAARTRAAQIVVEALRVADVLEPDRESDAAADALSLGRVAQPRPGGGAGHAGAPPARERGAPPRAGSPRRVGSEPVTTCPVGSTSPGSRAFRRRSSTGSIPSSAARRSICASLAKHVWTAPKPRIAPQGGLFV